MCWVTGQEATSVRPRGRTCGSWAGPGFLGRRPGVLRTKPAAAAASVCPALRPSAGQPCALLVRVAPRGSGLEQQVAGAGAGSLKGRQGPCGSWRGTAKSPLWVSVSWRRGGGRGGAGTGMGARPSTPCLVAEMQTSEHSTHTISHHAHSVRREQHENFKSRQHGAGSGRGLGEPHRVGGGPTNTPHLVFVFLYPCVTGHARWLSAAPASP